jgi:hypothetical protein
MSGAVRVTEVGGFAGVRMKRNISARLATFDIDRYVQLVEAHDYRQWKWIGEQPGKWLDASILASGAFGEAELQEQAASILKRLIAAQQRDGYLGITDTALRTPEHPLRGMDAYELYFTLHGLLTAHEEWRSDAALNSASRLGDYFVERIGPGKAEFWPNPPETTIAGHAGHRGFEGTLLIDPMMRLYQSTGEHRYLRWCQWVVSNMDKWSGTNFYSNLDKVARGEMGVNQLLPKVHAHTFQMNMLGIMRLAAATGERTYLDKVQGAWRDITARRMYITGGAGYKEYYRGDFELPNEGEGVETCSVMSWIQLNQALLHTTGDPAHADVIERAMWNHSFATQTWDGDGFRYGVPMAGWKPSLYFTGPNCCSSSGPRMLALLPGMIYGSGPKGIYVNQFVDSKAKIDIATPGAVELTQRTDYPAGEKIRIEIAPKSPAKFAVHVRIPKWCGEPKLRVNGRPVSDVQPGAYTNLDRMWRKGDFVELVLPMEAKWTKGEHGNAGLSALTRGPMVYVLDAVWQVPARLAGIKAPEHLVASETPERALGPFYRGDTSVTLSPFANLGRWYADAASKPDIKEKLYPYAVWLPA